MLACREWTSRRGQLVAPAIDSDGEFEIGWYDMTPDTLYMVVNRAGRRPDRASRHRHR